MNVLFKKISFSVGDHASDPVMIFGVAEWSSTDHRHETITPQKCFLYLIMR
jgi:hypothetical protein